MTTGNDQLSALVAGAAERARTEPGADPTTERLAVVLVRAGLRWFAVDAAHVREVVDRAQVSRVPYAAAHVAGLAMIHGRLVPVVSLERMLDTRADGAGAAALARGGRLVVVADGDREIAVAAATVRGIVSLAVDGPALAPPSGAPWVSRELPWNDTLVGVVDVARFVDAATART